MGVDDHRRQPGHTFLPPLHTLARLTQDGIANLDRWAVANLDRWAVGAKRSCGLGPGCGGPPAGPGAGPSCWAVASGSLALHWDLALSWEMRALLLGLALARELLQLLRCAPAWEMLALRRDKALSWGMRALLLGLALAWEQLQLP